MRVVVTSVNLAAPDTYTCSITAPAATSCPGITYEKKIQVYNLSKSSSVPEMTYAIDCDSLQGKFESAELGSIQGSKKYDNRQIVSWNTNPDSSLSFQRYEFLDLNKEYQLIGTTWTTIGEWREMGRVFKTALNKVQFLNFSFGTHTDDGTNWQQQLDARSTLLIPSASIACIDNKSQAFTNVDPTYVLTAGSTIASYRTTQVAATSTADEMNYNSAFNTAAVSAATTTCTSTYVLDALPAANNNDQINKSLVPEVNSLADGMMDAEFGSFLGI
jgi:hypothetical protein